MFDFGPAAEQMGRLVAGVGDDQLSHPTPCPAYTLGDLVEHVLGLSHAFTAAATKQPLAGADAGPSGAEDRLPPGWRKEISRRLEALVVAWRADEAWRGSTMAGPVEMPADQAALVALDELVVHGWDVAVSSGQPFDVDPASRELVHGFVSSFAAAGQALPGLFGPPVEVPPDAPELDRLVALAGRDPRWAAS